MARSESELRTTRRLFAGMGLFLLVYAALVVWTGQVTVSGKHHGPVLYSGTEALYWAGTFACFGIAMFAVFFRSTAAIATWMGLWIFAGVAAVLVPAFL